jgi:ABC-type nitrate/sulfonate/bicarbonate transport system ATPase subunit
VRGVSKWFDTADGQPLQVLKDIDLAVPEHSILAILGASGCGKSTLLNIISGLVTPERGEIRISGVPQKEFTDWRSMGYVFQDDRLLPWRTAMRNVEFSLEAGSMPREQRHARAREALSSSGSTGSRTLSPLSFPAACAAAWRSRAGWCSNQASCSWMSLSPGSTPRPAHRCTASCCAFMASST